MLAVWKLGGIAVAINPMLTPREIAKLIGDSTPVAFLALSELYSDELADTLAESSVWRVITTSALDFQHRGYARVLPSVRLPTPSGTEDLKILVAQYDGHVPRTSAIDPDDVAVVTYTSGTTGAPKGAMNTHETWRPVGWPTATGSASTRTTWCSASRRCSMSPACPATSRPRSPPGRHSCCPTVSTSVLRSI